MTTQYLLIKALLCFTVFVSSNCKLSGEYILLVIGIKTPGLGGRGKPNAKTFFVQDENRRQEKLEL